MSQVRVRLFGQFDGEIGRKKLTKFRTNKVQALLVYLIIENKHAVRRDVLLDLLWPGLPQKSAQVNLRQILYQLRKSLDVIEGDVLVREQRTVRLGDKVLGSADIHTFNQLFSANNAHNHSDIRSCTECRERLEQAVFLYKGSLLDGFYVADSNVFEEWLSSRRAAYERQFFDALSTLTTIYLHSGRFGDAAQSARKQLGYDNLRESAHRQLMEALAQSGQREAALAQYDQCRALLFEELGMSPTQRTIQLADQIIAGDLELQIVVQTPELRGYELLEKLGSGAYGDVHRAYQPLIEREVAVKIIKPEFANRPDFIRRFEIEAQTIAQLEHPYIVPLYDFWREPDGAFLVMRFMRGGSLDDALQQNSAWSVTQTLRLVDQIGAALVASHQQGVVHRDLKPANILLDEDGNSYLADFGIARNILDSQPSSAPHQTTSPFYTSPEQLRGEATTPQSDIYTFGFLLYELLVGQKPFPTASLGSMVLHHLETPLPSIVGAGLPSAVDDVVQKATAKLPADRFESVPAFVAALHQAINQNGSAGGMAFAPSTGALLHENPYKGLRAFQEGDADRFFGRNNLTTKLLNTAAQSRFLAVVGPSGSGKSSVVKAGVLPALREGVLRQAQGIVAGSDDWFIVEMVPSTHPFEELEAALLRVAVDPPDNLLAPLQKDERGLIRTLKRIMPPTEQTNGEPGQLLLVIDQFEELFTLAASETRRQFVDCLVTALQAPRGQLRVIVTLRADFYHRPLQIPNLAKLIEAHTEVVTPLDSAELEQTIVRPAALAGVRFADGLVPKIIEDVRDQPGMLPLLQYALTELFERRDNNLIPLSAYEALGGVSGILGKRAEEIYEALSAENQTLAKQLLLRLVTLGEGSEDTRRRVLQSELEALLDRRPQTADGGSLHNSDFILHNFGAARLLSFDRDPATRTPAVEVAHEALLREWPRLRRWLNESREDLRFQRRLGVLSAEYSQSNQDPSFLLRGGQLQQFEDWTATTTVALTINEQQYLTVSIDARATHHAAEEARRRREIEHEVRLSETERLRAIAQKEAEDQLLAAQRQAQLAHASELAAKASLAVLRDPELSMLLALESLKLAKTKDGETALHVALQNSRVRQTYNVGSCAVALSPNKQLLAISYFQSNSFSVCQLSTMEPILSGVGIAYGFIGDTLLYVNSQGYGKSESAGVMWDIEQCEIIYSPVTATIKVSLLDSRAAAVDPQFKLFAFVDARENIVLLSTATGKPIATITKPDAKMASLQFSQDGRLLAGFDHGSHLYVWSIETTLVDGNVERQTDFPIFGGRNPGHGPILFSSDNKRLIVGASSGIEIWNLQEPSVPRHHYYDNEQFIQSLQLSDDESLLAASAGNGDVYMLDMLTGDLLFYLKGHTNTAFIAGFLKNDTQLITSSLDGTIRIWDVRRLNGSEIQAYSRVIFPGSLEVSPDGNLFAVGSVQAPSYLFERSSGKIIQRFGDDKQTSYRIAFSPDGNRLTAGGTDDIIRSWDIATGELLLEFKAHESELFGGFYRGIIEVTYSPDGVHFATASSDKVAHLWHAVTGELAQSYWGYAGGISCLRFSPNGKLVVLGGEDDTADQAEVWVFDAVSGKHLRTLGKVPVQVWGIAFHPTEPIVVASGWGGVLKGWNAETGEELYSVDAVGGGTLWQMSFSPDGKYVAVSGAVALISLYDAYTGELVSTLSDRAFGFATFTPDNLLLGASVDGAVREITVALEDAVALAEQRATRDLTEQERLHYLRSADCEVPFGDG